MLCLSCLKIFIRRVHERTAIAFHRDRKLPFSLLAEFASQHLEKFGTNEFTELQEDAIIIAVHDQMEAGVDVITDGEQSRLDFNLSFYGYLHGIQPNERPLRVFGPPAHDQRGKHNSDSICRQVALPSIQFSLYGCNYSATNLEGFL